MKYFLQAISSVVLLSSISHSSLASDFVYFLKCDYSDKKSSQHPFYLVGKKEGAQIIYLKSSGSFFTYLGGENSSLALIETSKQFYEYRTHRQETSQIYEATIWYSLDRISLRLGEKTLIKKDKEPSYGSYSCSKVQNEKQEYLKAMELKRKFDSGSYNKI